MEWIVSPYHIAREKAVEGWQAVSRSSRAMTSRGFTRPAVIGRGAYLGWFSVAAQTAFPEAALRPRESQSACRVPPRYGGLDVIRALAALLVVYNHFFLFGLFPQNQLLSLPAHYATEAVMVFFVLSGTVITISTDRSKKLLNSRTKVALPFMAARALRICPVFWIGLALAAIAEHSTLGHWPSLRLIAGNLAFVQSLQGFITSPPQFNMPLWSLACEMTYYFLFTGLILWRRVGTVAWIAAAVVCAAISPPSGTGPAPHFIYVLAFSIPWLMGHLAARHRDRLPQVSIPFGLAFILIGTVFARCPLTRDYFDIFRLSSFALCCCPLMLAIIQGRSANQDIPWLRIAAAALAIALLWTISPSLFIVKSVLTLAGLLGAFSPLAAIQWLLDRLKPLYLPFAYIGSISYAIYAIHAPIIYLTVFVAPAPSRPAKLIICCLAILVLAHLLERVIQPRLSGRGRLVRRTA